jgi:sec-independent protein translocase protein TatB
LSCVFTIRSAWPQLPQGLPAGDALREGLGPEFSDFDIDDLNPRRFVQKHLFSDLNDSDSDATDIRSAAANAALLPGGEPSFDTDAT